MKLKFQRIVLDHFKSFEGLELDLDEFGTGLHFWRGVNKLDKALGSNGAGKTSLWDALCWCLYGRTPKGLKSTDVRPFAALGYSGPTNVLVVVSVDGKTKEVQRQANPNRLMIDGKDASQAAVDKLIGLEADVFFHTVVLGQGLPLFFDLAPRDKMALFSTVLNLDRWEVRADAARDKATRLEKLEARLTGERSTLDNRQSMVHAELKNLRERLDEWEEDRNKKLDKVEREHKAAQEQYGKLQKEADKADLAYDGAMMDLRLLDKDHDHLFKDLNEAAMRFERHDIGIAKLREEADQLDFDLTMIPGKCQTCGQPIGGKERKHVREHMLDRIDALDEKVKADKVGPKLRLEVVRIKGEEERITTIMAGFRAKADDAKRTIDMAIPILAQLKATIDSRDERERELKETHNPYHEQVQARRKEQSKLKGDIRELEERLERLSGQIARTKFWVKGFRDVRLYVIDALMDELEMATNTMLPEVGLSDWQVHFDVEKTTKAGTTSRGLNTLILSPDNDKPVRWEVWSGGETQRLRIVGALAFADVLLRHAGVEVDLEVLDEPTQHLSVEGVRDLCDFLQTRAKAFELALHYVDHQSIESARFDSVHTIIKGPKGSRLSTSQ